MNIIQKAAFKPIFRYNREWYREDAQITEWEIELIAFDKGLTPEQGGLGVERHYMNLVSTAFKDYKWHDWAVRGARALCRYNGVGMMGCANSGKSDGAHTWALLKWLADPVHTTVICTTTDVSAAGQRGWGHLISRWKALRESGFSRGKLVESLHIIRLTDGAVSDSSSISLVAAGNQDKDEALRKLQGRKARSDEDGEGRMIVILDELQDLAHGLIDEALPNLVNNPEVHIVGLGNPQDQLDPLGKFCTPTGGWGSVSVNDKQWDISPGYGISGVCLHFDAEDSPNIPYYMANGQNKYGFLPRMEIIESHRALGDNHPDYWRQHRGFIPPAHVDVSRVLNAPLITKYKAAEKECDLPGYWAESPIRLATIDPSYTEGGDKFMYFPSLWGQRADDGIWTLHYLDPIALNKAADFVDKKEEQDFHYKMIGAIKARISADGVDPKNMAVDASAGGLFWSMGEREGLRGWLPVDFGGAASELPVSYQENMMDAKGEPKKARELFANKVSELWYVFRHFLETNQIRGMHPDQIWEMCRRKKRDRAGKIMLESKRDMKARIHRSPDTADAGVLGLELVRQRYGAVAGGAAKIEHQRQKKAQWDAFLKKLDPVRFDPFRGM